MKTLSYEQMQGLETPCIVVDMEQVQRNIRKMQEIADRRRCCLRPHIKTHKSAQLARMQLEAGACGISCATVSEAEIMAAAGIEDIFIAYPLVGTHKLIRAEQLYRRVKRLILAVDSVEGAKALSRLAVSGKLTLEVRLEIDTGAGRTGIPMAELKKTGQEIWGLEGLAVTGIYTFKSLIYRGQPTKDAGLAGAEEGAMMAEAAKLLREIGFAIREVSAGSTPTAEACAATGMVSEVRPGSYIYYDRMTYLEGACAAEEIAAAVYATVVSTPEPSMAVVDGGSKTFSGDVILGSPPFYFDSYAFLPDHPHLLLERMNEEHGILRSRQGPTGLSVGDVVAMIPLHICTAVNLQDHFYAVSENRIRQMPVDARGALV